MTETTQLPEQELDPMSHLEIIIKGWVAKTQFEKDQEWYKLLKEQYQ